MHYVIIIIRQQPNRDDQEMQRFVHILQLLHINYANNSLEIHLQDIEKKHNIMRWTPLDKEYVELDHILKLNMQETLLLQLLKSANRRLFLLKLKKKYAGLSTEVSF